MPRTPDAAYQELTRYLRDSAVLASCSSVLDWDEQTSMPDGGVEHRSNQLSLLAGLIHDRSTAPFLGELLSELEHSDLLASPDSPPAVNIREARRDYDRATRLPRRLIEELSKTASLAHQGWVAARKAARFEEFRPWLEKIVALKREEAQAIGYGTGAPYDALLDQYEPGMTVDRLQRLFTPLREELVTLIAAIGNSGRQPKREILTRRYPIAVQRQFATTAATQIGFDFNCGRLDEAPHPFCSGFGPGDTRLTTRYDERHFPGAFFGTLHEAGHGIYDQGLDREAYGLPMGEAVSLGIHESQSRMWENFVGRSRSFWTFFFPKAQAAFPEALGGVPLDEFYAAVNDVQQSFIRVEADETTYNLHILLRFEIEQELIADQLRPEDVPDVWNTKFTKYFGITPPNAAQGCLQDIHWSMGGIGYFPTYTLGNMNAAQFFSAAKNELGNLDALFARGEFAPLKHWLNEQIHRRGKQYRAERLVEVVTGQPLSHVALMSHLRGKLEELYGL
jgi:carboxypeptidase Taq